ncbi:hypothetical protein [Streptomyces sp. NBC_01294]|nr:hypothetical protein [Streptomyces sp. NBC_01294]WRZ59594.1 hypothetical protein OG534_25785 [Streptomyces sp. NBC_01294]
MTFRLFPAALLDTAPFPMAPLHTALFHTTPVHPRDREGRTPC